MGSFFSRLSERLRGVTEVRLLMLGLDNAGKTTILYKLRFNQTVTTIPTAGFNVECLTHKNVKFHVWDVGGQDKIRPLWRHYHTGTKALIFVIDSQDRDRMHEARLELHRILTARELADAILLVFANKQDLRQSMDVEEVQQRLQLQKFPNRCWKVQPSCATSGEGLVEGLNWLADNIRNPPSKKKQLQHAQQPQGSPAVAVVGSPRPITPLPSSPSASASISSSPKAEKVFLNGTRPPTDDAGSSGTPISYHSTVASPHPVPSVSSNTTPEDNAPPPTFEETFRAEEESIAAARESRQKVQKQQNQEDQKGTTDS